MHDTGERTLDKLRSLIAGREPASGCRLLGLIGRGIGSSRTPMMHEREAARQGIACRYLLLDFDELDLPDGALPSVVAAAGRVGFCGLNVTHPFKQAVIPHLQALAPEAAAIGAVNTIVFAGASATGYNTDSWGFAASFREGLSDVSRSRVVMFGAGGAGAAVAHALMEQGVQALTLVDTDRPRAHALAQRMAARVGDRVKVATEIESALDAADGIVNATPVGMTKYPGMPFGPFNLRPRHWVAEIIYFPAETEMLRRARALGCRTLAGTGMAVGQAVRAFELFTGKKPDPDAMAGHFVAGA